MKQLQEKLSQALGSGSSVGGALPYESGLNLYMLWVATQDIFCLKCQGDAVTIHDWSRILMYMGHDLQDGNCVAYLHQEESH